MVWDPSKHPRVPAGSHEGGQFGMAKGRVQIRKIPNDRSHPGTSLRHGQVVMGKRGLTHLPPAKDFGTSRGYTNPYTGKVSKK